VTESNGSHPRHRHAAAHLRRGVESRVAPEIHLEDKPGRWVQVSSCDRGREPGFVLRARWSRALARLGASLALEEPVGYAFDDVQALATEPTPTSEDILGDARGRVGIPGWD
jgi:hypothetical protein